MEKQTRGHENNTFLMEVLKHEIGKINCLELCRRMSAGCHDNAQV